MRLVGGAILALALASGIASAAESPPAPASSPAVFPTLTLQSTVVARGDILEIVRSEALPGTPVVDLCPDLADVCSGAVPVDMAQIGKDRIVLQIGPNVPPGRYRVRVRFGQNNEFAGPILTIRQPVVETAVDARVTAEGGRRSFSMGLIGSGFSRGDHAVDNILVFKNRPPIVPCLTPSTAANAAPCVRVQSSDDGRYLSYTGIPESYAGTDRVAVRIGGSGEPERFVMVTLPLPPFYMQAVTMVAVTLIAGGVFIGGLILALYCVWKLRKGLDITQRPNLFEILLLDPKTLTYSLANFQLVAWSATFLVAYSYLFVGRVFWQNGTDLIDLPGDFATMLGATAGTSVVSTITGTKGSKGSGEVHPALSDLVSNGGVFAPERFQFLVWTIVGIAGYLMLTFRQSLDSVTSLPNVSQGFLAITGVSSLAYLGGKLARAPGPIIATVTRQANRGDEVVFRITGEQLSIESAASYDVKNSANAATPAAIRATPTPALSVITPSTTPGYATVLELTLPAGFPLPGEITITNPDKQKSVAVLAA
jgi:hypothetical protein